MMFRHVYGTDPDAETVASFNAAVDMIPRTIKRRFGYGVVDDERAEYEAEEFARLERYTDFSFSVLD